MPAEKTGGSRLHSLSLTFFEQPPIDDPAKRSQVHLGPMIVALMLADNYYHVCMDGDDPYNTKEYIEQHCQIVAQLMLQGRNDRKAVASEADSATISKKRGLTPFTGWQYLHKAHPKL